MAKKKEKIIYVDDGRTVADMSGVSGGFRTAKPAAGRPRASLKEQLGTFWGAMKMMFLPMLAVTGAICVIFVILYLFFLAM